MRTLPVAPRARGACRLTSLLTYTASSTAPPATAWRLYAEPRRWSSWAPHVRGAWGLGHPEVRAGARGAVRLLGLIPVPARVTSKGPGRSWSWRVGPVELVHRVEARAGGCVVALDILAPAPLEAALRRTYGPLTAMLLRNLARVAETEGVEP